MRERNISTTVAAFACFLAVIMTAAGVPAQTPMSRKTANSIMSRSPAPYTDGGRSWSYVIGTVLKAFQELYLRTDNAAYLTYIRNTVDAEVNSNGTMNKYKVTDYNLDQVREGASALFLYRETGQAKYKTAVDLIRTQLNVGQQPRTSEGGFWHKQVYPYQMWQDGLYMAEPFYAEYSKTFNNADTADLNDIVKQFILMEKHARDNTTGLIYHGWDEKKAQSWADPVTGCSKSFWGRAMGWYAMALVDVLDYLPSGYAKRADLIAILQRLASAIVNYQDSVSGCWYQVVDQGGRTGNYLESSATCMFVYSLFKSVRLGYIDRSFQTAALKGYQGILATFVTENGGNITVSKTCQSAGLSDDRNGTFDYYISEPVVANDGKALGPFILSSLEYENITTARPALPDVQTTNHGRLSVFIDARTGRVTVRLSCAKQTMVAVALFSIDGKELVRRDFGSLRQGVHTPTVDMSHFPAGIYLLKCLIGNFSVSSIIHFNGGD